MLLSEENFATVLSRPIFKETNKQSLGNPYFKADCYFVQYTTVIENKSRQEL